MLQNYASLASIHSYAEQEQAVGVCASMRTGAEGEGAATVAGDTATGGGYGASMHVQHCVYDSACCHHIQW